VITLNLALVRLEIVLILILCDISWSPTGVLTLQTLDVLSTLLTRTRLEYFGLQGTLVKSQLLSIQILFLTMVQILNSKCCRMNCLPMGVVNPCARNVVSCECEEREWWFLV